MDNLSTVSSSTSNLDESSRSNNSDGTYIPVYDDDNERNERHKLYDIEPSQDVPPKSNMCSLQEGGDQHGIADFEDACSVVETNVEDDSSVDEMYSDFEKKIMCDVLVT